MLEAELDLRLDSLRAQEGLGGALIDSFNKSNCFKVLTIIIDKKRTHRANKA